MYQTLNLYGTEAIQVFTQTANEVVDEMAKRDSAIAKELAQEMKPFADAFVNQMKSLQQELKAIKQTLVEMERNNTLYLGDINQAYNRTVDKFL